VLLLLLVDEAGGDFEMGLDAPQATVDCVEGVEQGRELVGTGRHLAQVGHGKANAGGGDAQRSGLRALCAAT